MSSHLENFLRSLEIAGVTSFFLYAILAAFIVAVVALVFKRLRNYTSFVPTLLTSMGILGTFVGIVIGLMGFEIANIDGSIEKLLAGMKTAFITSLWGITWSLIYRGVAVPIIMAFQKSTKRSSDSVSPAEVLAAIEAQGQSLDSLSRTIGEESESSVIGQLKLMRSDINDNSKAALKNLENIDTHVEKQSEAFSEFESKLWIKLQDFADMMSKSATEQVISALKEVITDFNNNLVEQFGENFKQLNQAVHELVEWQENYKAQLQDMREQYDNGVKAITATQTSVASIETHTENIPSNMKHLDTIIKTNQTQVEELSRHLEAFKDIRDRAVDAVPQIRDQIDLTLKGVNDATGELSKGLTESSAELQKAINDGAQVFVDNSQRVNESLQTSSDYISKNSSDTKELMEDSIRDLSSELRVLISDISEGSKAITTQIESAGKSVIDETNKTSQAFRDQIEDIQNRLDESIRNTTSHHASEAQKMLNGLSETIQKSLNDTGESVEKQVSMIDRTMQEEVNRVMQEMGRALTSISGQFTNDYQQL
ncbi:hypothetical protein, partial [Methylophaga sp. UBA3996]